MGCDHGTKLCDPRNHPKKIGSLTYNIIIHIIHMLIICFNHINISLSYYI
jgi:hypothetical protein